MDFQLSPSGPLVGIQLNGVTGSSVEPGAGAASLFTVPRPARVSPGAMVVGGRTANNGVVVIGGRATNTQLHVAILNTTGATVTVTALDAQLIFSS